MASEQLKRYLGKYDYCDSVKDLTIGYMFGITPEEASNIDYSDLGDDDSKFYDDVYSSVEKEINKRYESVRKRPEEKKMNESSVYDHMTDRGKKLYELAKKCGIGYAYNPFMGNFEFSIAEVISDKDGIRKFISEAPEEYILNRETVVPEDMINPEDFSDGYIYYLTDRDYLENEVGMENIEVVDIDSINEGCGRNKKSKKKLKESTNGKWRGCDNIEMISHGIHSDPDLYTVIDGMSCYFNYWDIENALWSDFLEETGHTDNESGNPEVEEEFNKYCQKWAYYYMIDCFNNGYFGNPYEDGEYSNGEFCSWRTSDFVNLKEGYRKSGKKKLAESRGWKIELVSGPALKSAIHDDDSELVLDCLADCWREINEKMPDAYDDDDLGDILEEIENIRDDLEKYEEFGMTYEDVEDEINYLLHGLYEFCDDLRIWIGI